MTANTCGFSRGLPGLNRLNQIFLILILKRFQRLCRGDSGPMSHFSDYSQLHVVQCLRGVLCAWRVREVSLQIIHKWPLGKHNNQGGRLLPRQ